MQPAKQELSDLNELRTYVQKTLCEHNNLEMNAFSVSERILVRRQRPCGMLFCLHGPRSVRLTAVWECDQNTILFYNSAGERVGRTQLVGVQAPAICS